MASRSVYVGGMILLIADAPVSAACTASAAASAGATQPMWTTTGTAPPTALIAVSATDTPLPPTATRAPTTVPQVAAEAEPTATPTELPLAPSATPTPRPGYFSRDQLIEDARQLARGPVELFDLGGNRVDGGRAHGDGELRASAVHDGAALGRQRERAADLLVAAPRAAPVQKAQLCGAQRQAGEGQQ